MDEKVKELNLAIDENDMLTEWKGQAQMMLTYSTQLADAMQEEDEAKARLAVVAAGLDANIRRDPTSFGLAKATEAAIVGTIPGHDRHIAAMEILNNARYSVRIMRAAVDALGHRKSALQGMTDLFMRQWFADPTNNAQPSELRDAASKAKTKAIKGRRRRNKRVDSE